MLTIEQIDAEINELMTQGVITKKALDDVYKHYQDYVREMNKNQKTFKLEKLLLLVNLKCLLKREA